MTYLFEGFSALLSSPGLGYNIKRQIVNSQPYLQQSYPQDLLSLQVKKCHRHMFSVKQTDYQKLHSSISILPLLFFWPAIKRSRDWKNRHTG